ncbi:eukaryotic release factor 1 (eRF1) family protein [Actinidia rufa]|uniref:Eukaryotic release factor 1 (ERF1) family protein n=1 Tax=Actinidia rufa TaxID=165716 RepID=A0A7J0E0T9_9ERIC|nr:eukaryotic release factor 1 (eRF1) family protein [Actinidia rufa]
MPVSCPNCSPDTCIDENMRTVAPVVFTELTNAIYFLLITLSELLKSSSVMSSVWMALCSFAPAPPAVTPPPNRRSRWGPYSWRFAPARAGPKPSFVARKSEAARFREYEKPRPSRVRSLVCSFLGRAGRTRLCRNPRILISKVSFTRSENDRPQQDNSPSGSDSRLTFFDSRKTFLKVRMRTVLPLAMRLYASHKSSASSGSILTLPGPLGTRSL